MEHLGKETFALNILDRGRNQLREDQRSDVTLEKVRSKASLNPPEKTDGYFFDKHILMHRKFSEDFHNELRHVDRVVVPESYRSEVLRVGHTIPLAGHMGSTKTFNRIAAFSFWPGLPAF